MCDKIIDDLLNGNHGVSEYRYIGEYLSDMRDNARTEGKAYTENQAVENLQQLCTALAEVLKASFKEVPNEVQALEDEVYDLERKVDRLEDTVAQLEAALDSAHDDIGDLEDEVEDLKAAKDDR